MLVALVLIFVLLALVIYLVITLRSIRKKALDFEERYRRLLDDATLGIFQATLDGKNVMVNPAHAHMFGYEGPEELLSLINNVGTQLYVHPERRQEIVACLLETGKAATENLYRRKDGSTFPGYLHAWLVRDKAGNPQYIEGFVEDITERKQTEERLKHQVQRLEVLRQVDNAITSSTDLEAVLRVVLKHIRSQLGVDAADILVLDPKSQRLECAAYAGFKTNKIAATSLRLGEGYAGTAASERRMIRASKIGTQTDHLLASPMLGEEEFVLYYGVPLLMKNQVNGVLEVFSRTMLNTDADWENFLQILAGQAAIAVENASLYENLKAANSKLLFAYDETIEAWARALEIHDKETKDHSQRVTENTLVMAIALGIKDGEELVQAYRGALLHDIGKMGIPDTILNKPGPLTKEEWEVMKQHPNYAYELLSPIEFLQKALDIPYCHHEKWDGTGYQRGLKGEEIPLTARIFAVIDVWDALLADRPYRPAWTEEQARQYLREQAGKHFDPRVVEVFLQRF